MASDLPRFRQRCVPALLAVVLACSLTRPAHATVVFTQPPDEPASDPVAEPPPPEPAPSEPTSTVTVGPDTDYEAFANSLPDDFDINYQFIPALEPEKDKPNKRLSKKQKDALSVTGSLIMVACLLVGGGLIGPGAFQVSDAKEVLATQPGLDDQQQAIEKGKQGNTLLIAGAATLGGGFVVFLPLVVLGRDKRGSGDSSEARVQFAPMLTRSTTGAAMLLRF